MRVLIMGNSGSGKSWKARELAAQHQLHHLDLDTIVWVPELIAVARPRDQALADLSIFAQSNANWVIEGCYGDFVEAVLPHCTELLFMNPGKDVCLANNGKRPWEAHKYESKEKQDSMLAFLLDWVGKYYERDDTCSYSYHRRVFDGFTGDRREITGDQI
ncbi:MAG: shikimate kinase [Bdellovibrionales bacterium]|nr:shikimate kinase [Massilia sp.]